MDQGSRIATESSTNITLWTVPAQPLPEGGLRPAIFVTIWWYFCLSVSFYISTDVPLPVLRTTGNGAQVLNIWFLVTLIDRWIHYTHRSVSYGYIVALSVWELLRVFSTILLLSGASQLVQRELQVTGRVTNPRPWWLAAKFSILTLGIISIFYAALQIALAVVWLNFAGLTTIVDIATKRTDFQLAAAAGFWVFSLYIFAAATYAVFFRIYEIDGNLKRSNVNLWIATILLLMRSTAEFAITSIFHGTTRTRRDVAETHDIAYGLLTLLYLACILAAGGAMAIGEGRSQTIEFSIRKEILQRLGPQPAGSRRMILPFGAVLQQLQEAIEAPGFDGSDLVAGSKMKARDIKSIALAYLERLREDFERLNTTHRAELEPQQGNGGTVNRIVDVLDRFVRDQRRPDLVQPRQSNESMRRAAIPRPRDAQEARVFPPGPAGPAGGYNFERRNNINASANIINDNNNNIFHRQPRGQAWEEDPRPAPTVRDVQQEPMARDVQLEPTARHLQPETTARDFVQPRGGRHWRWPQDMEMVANPPPRRAARGLGVHTTPLNTRAPRQTVRNRGPLQDLEHTARQAAGQATAVPPVPRTQAYRAPYVEDAPEDAQAPVSPPPDGGQQREHVGHPPPGDGIAAQASPTWMPGGQRMPTQRPRRGFGTPAPGP